MDIKDISKDSGDVVIEGWVHDYRDIGGLKFLLVRDSTGLIQVTAVKNKTDPSIIDLLTNITNESAVRVFGKVQASTKVKSGLEVLPTKLEVLSQSLPNLPISVTEKGITTGQAKRFDWRSLDLRKLEHQAIFRIQSALLEGIQQYLLKEGFTQVFTPCVIGTASESGSEVFPIIYFDREAFLRQDPQLHRQLTIAGGLKRVFDIGPAWRAEQSHTVKHLCEHRVCAVETSFIKDETDTMRLEEQIIISALTTVKEKCQNELKIIGIDIKIPKIPFPEFQFPEIYPLLKKYGKVLPEGQDLDSESEKILWDHVKKTYDCEFYFVKRFPSKIKPFYVMKIDEDPTYARSVDLYFRGLELSSGGQREHRYDKLMEAVKQKGVKESEISWFSQFFQYGVPPHGGFAIGIERLTQSLLNVENIRDCVLFPRDPQRLVP